MVLKIIMYFDGIAVDSSSNLFPDITNSNIFNEPSRIGENQQTSSRLKGAMDDIRFYNSANCFRNSGYVHRYKCSKFQGVLAMILTLTEIP